MIERISIKGLFGIYNPEIKLNKDITIIHGPNGCGKTTILRMLDYLFTKNTEQLCQIEFETIKLFCSNKQQLVATRKPIAELNPGSTEAFSRKQHKRRSYYIEFQLNKDGQVFKSPTIETAKAFFSTFSNDNYALIRRNFMPFERTNDEQFLKYLESAFTRDTLDERYFELYSMTGAGFNWQLEISEPIAAFLDSIDIKFITSDRLRVETKKKGASYGEETTAIEERVSIYAKEIASKIVRTLQDYGDVAQKLDRSFPHRVINEPKLLSVDEILSRLNILEAQRKHYSGIGLLDEEKDEIFQKEIRLTQTARRTLSLYVKDNEKKLAVVEELSKKISLYKRLLDNKFITKEIIFSKEKGFVFRLKENGKILVGKQLSSGEQQELVLLYNMVFETTDRTLLLIDEPELSLHIKWQYDFIDDMLEIIKANGFRAIVATHSPEIIDDRWDLTVKLLNN